jgi:adenylate cyclase
MDAAFEDMGEQEVKNIPEPVRMYRWTDDSADPMPSPLGAVGALPLPDKPSIVVLPFDDMSGDAGDPYFADGVTEDIITELSRFSNLFVIARNSAFTYKGRAVRAQEIRRDLGVRYIVEGSVRRAGDQVRVTVQLIDSETGSHVWADRYDRELGDIFDLQDELTQAIVATLPGRLLVAEEKRIRRKPPQQMAAYDYVLAGRIHHHRVTSEDNAEALRMLETAIQLDPGFAEAYAWKACTLGQALQFGFCTDFAKTEEKAFAAIDKALSLDENDVECHRLLCEVRMESRRFDQAETHSELALAMNPNDPRIVAQRGELLTWLGRPDEGVEWIEKAMRVDPLGAPGRAHLLGRAFYTARRYAEAIDAFKKIVSPSYMHLAEVAACHARIGDQVCANESAVAALRLNPDFSVDQYMRTRTYQNVADAAHLAEGMRAAGLPA